jgi:ketosteroid isomerase-like protein
MSMMVLVAHAPARTVIAEPDPRSVLAAYTAAINRGDSEAAFALFADDAAVTSAVQGASYHGREEVRGFLERLVAAHFYYEAVSPRAEGNRVSADIRLWSDAWRNLGVTPVRGRLEVEVEDGLFRSFVATLTAESEARIAAAGARILAVEHVLAALNRGDLEAALAVLSDEVTVLDPEGERISGRVEAGMLFAGLIEQDLELRPLAEPWVSGDRVTLLVAFGVGTHHEDGTAHQTVLGDFYVREGLIVSIVARALPAGQ